MELEVGTSLGSMFHRRYDVTSSRKPESCIYFFFAGRRKKIPCFFFHVFQRELARHKKKKKTGDERTKLTHQPCGFPPASLQIYTPTPAHEEPRDPGHKKNHLLRNKPNDERKTRCGTCGGGKLWVQQLSRLPTPCSEQGGPIGEAGPILLPEMTYVVRANPYELCDFQVKKKKEKKREVPSEREFFCSLERKLSLLVFHDVDDEI